MQNSNSHSEPDRKMVNEAYRLRATDRVKSFLALEAFAEQGSKVSLLFLSDMFCKNVDLNDLIERAKRLNERAKEAHLGEASYRFGVGFYRFGDYAAAFDAFSWGAGEGYAPSIYRLANMYLNGVHVEKDYHKAKRLLEVAAKKGNRFARKDLAHVLLMKNFGLIGKIRGVGIFFVLVVYQIEEIIRVIKKQPLDERYFH